LTVVVIGNDARATAVTFGPSKRELDAIVTAAAAVTAAAIASTTRTRPVVDDTLRGSPD
jgi:hypothetical protein